MFHYLEFPARIGWYQAAHRCDNGDLLFVKRNGDFLWRHSGIGRLIKRFDDRVLSMTELGAGFAAVLVQRSPQQVEVFALASRAMIVVDVSSGGIPVERLQVDGDDLVAISMFNDVTRIGKVADLITKVQSVKPPPVS